MQEVLARVVPLQEAVARVVAMQEVLARSVAGWLVDGAPGGRGKAGGVIGLSADQGTRLYARHQGPCTSLLPRVLSHGHSRCLCGKASRLGNAEGH